MGKVESIYPEIFRDLSVNPFLEELKSFFKVLNKSTKRLEGWVALLKP